MECRVCGFEVGEGKAKCPRCDFPVMMMVQGDKHEEEKVRQLADNFREKKFKGICVKLKVYTNEMSGDEVIVKETSDIVLLDGSKMSEDEIIWYPEKFARLSSDPELDITVQNIRGEEKKITLRLDNPNIKDFWYIGVLVEKGLECRVVLGNEEKFVQSEMIQLY